MLHDVIQTIKDDLLSHGSKISYLSTEISFRTREQLLSEYFQRIALTIPNDLVEFSKLPKTAPGDPLFTENASENIYSGQLRGSFESFIEKFEALVHQMQK
jgi:hypothetical protein